MFAIIKEKDLPDWCALQPQNNSMLQIADIGITPEPYSQIWYYNQGILLGNITCTLLLCDRELVS